MRLIKKLVRKLKNSYNIKVPENLKDYIITDDELLRKTKDANISLSDTIIALRRNGYKKTRGIPI